jgi:hypothetical protein
MLLVSKAPAGNRFRLKEIFIFVVTVIWISRRLFSTERHSSRGENSITNPLIFYYRELSTAIFNCNLQLQSSTAIFNCNLQPQSSTAIFCIVGYIVGPGGVSLTACGSSSTIFGVIKSINSVRLRPFSVLRTNAPRIGISAA